MHHHFVPEVWVLGGEELRPNHLARIELGRAPYGSLHLGMLGIKFPIKIMVTGEKPLDKSPLVKSHPVKS